MMGASKSANIVQYKSVCSEDSLKTSSDNIPGEILLFIFLSTAEFQQEKQAMNFFKVWQKREVDLQIALMSMQKSLCCQTICDLFSGSIASRCLSLSLYNSLFNYCVTLCVCQHLTPLLPARGEMSTACALGNNHCQSPAEGPAFGKQLWG